MDDFDLSLVTEGEIQTRYDLRAEFYRRNRFREYFWDGTSKLSASRPLAMIRFETDVQDLLRVQYGRDYYVIIEKGHRLMDGPHTGKLYLSHKCEPEGIWLGTKQFDGSFFDDKSLKHQLREAIKCREYWMSDDSEDEEFVLEEQEEIVDMSVEEHIQLPLRKNCKGFRVYFVPLKRAGCVPRCPKCLCEKPLWRNIRSHYFKKHGKKLFVFLPKPIDKCPPM